jgi:hypothetical protein
MVGGDFDDHGGQDLSVLVDAQLLVHPSDGMTGFGPPTVTPAPLPEPRGMVAEQLDLVLGTERLLWGSSGAALLDVAGASVALLDGDLALPAGLRSVRRRSSRRASSPRFTNPMANARQTRGMGRYLRDPVHTPSSTRQWNCAFIRSEESPR